MKPPRRHGGSDARAPRARFADGLAKLSDPRTKWPVLPRLASGLVLGLVACGAPDTRMPRQVDAPAISVVAPVIPEPRPAPPEPPPPPPPADGAELFARADWNERALDRVCQS